MALINETQATANLGGLTGQIYPGQFVVPVKGSLQNHIPYPTYPSGISETYTKHFHIDLGQIDWKDVTIIKGANKIILTPEEFAIKLGLEW